MNYLEGLELPDGFDDLSDMHQRVSFMIFGSVITSTRAFKSVNIQVVSKASLVIAKVKIGGIFAWRLFKPLHLIWLRRAELAAVPHVPKGWRLLICYDRQR
jgi:hypothetical protein